MTRTRQTVWTALLVALCLACNANPEERNEEIARAMIDAINARDFDALDTLVAADVRRHSAATPQVSVTSLEQFKEYLHQDLSVAPDARQEIDFMLAEGDRVAVRAIYRGTQTGALGPFPPSGRPMEIPFIGILRVERGKIAEMWVEWDNMNALTQLGHLPPPGESQETVGG